LKRREEGLGLGCADAKSTSFQWNDKFWEKSFDSVVKNLSIAGGVKARKASSVAEDESDND
jgi:hypothetical protein